MMLLRSPDEDERSERLEAERRAERAREHTPAYHPEPPTLPPPQVSSSPITSAMGTLARTVLHGNWHDARDASRALAELVLEAIG